MQAQKAEFNVGQIVHHKRFGYRGVIADVDATFQLSNDWYDHMAQSKPPRDRPWYQVLVHNEMHSTYVAERNLERDEDVSPIRHPMLEDYFSGYSDGSYHLRTIS